MKKFLAILLIALLHCLGAQPTTQPEPSIAERWEIVTDIYIGVQTEQLTEAERQSYGAMLPRHQGLRIKRVIPGSPAEEAGLQVGDLLLKNNGARIDSMEDLLLSVRNTHPGEFIYFNILRDGQRLPVTIKVAALPEPVVVAYATCRQRDLPGMVSIVENQRRIAGILAVAEPNLQAIYDEFNEINKLFPSLARPGHIRLYYETAAGYATVTAYTDKIIVTVPRGQQVDVYNLLQQGDTLPGAVRQLFR